MRKKLKIPNFKNEDVERTFWANADLTDYFTPKDFHHVTFPNLKPTSRSISLRIPEHLFARVKERANELNVPYQSLMKQFISKGVEVGKK